MKQWVLRIDGLHPKHFRISNDVRKIKAFVKEEYSFFCEKYEKFQYLVYDEDGELKGAITKVKVI